MKLVNSYILELFRNFRCIQSSTTTAFSAHAGDMPCIDDDDKDDDNEGGSDLCSECTNSIFDEAKTMQCKRIYIADETVSKNFHNALEHVN